MKKQIFTLSFIFLTSFLFAENNSTGSLRSLNGTNAINQFDTVFFDLVNATINGNLIDIPVFIKSDDVVNAVDFTMKFDLAKLRYDTLIKYRASLDPLANYNANDSTIRMTSFDLNQIPNDTPLVAIRFVVLNGTTILQSDFNSLTALLNGDPCTPVFIESPVLSLPSPVNNNWFELLVFPNPSTGLFNVIVSEQSTLHVFDLSGKQVLEARVSANEHKIIDLSGLASGSYLLKANNEKQYFSTKRITLVQP